MDQPFSPRACSIPVAVPVREFVTSGGMHVACYEVSLEIIPVDFFADPDGSWTFESLSAAAGFAVDAGVGVGALREPFNDHPEGAAVVTLNSEARPYVAIIECPIAFVPIEDARDVSAA